MFIAEIAVISAILELFTDDDTAGFGFRTVCSLAMTVAIVEYIAGILHF